MNRKPKKTNFLIFCCFSVVTSISVVREDDPEDMKEKYQKEYEQYSVDNVVATATDPKFKLYLYNEQGELVQENLSIHDIQHLLLHQTKKKFHRDSDNESDDEPDKSSGVSGIQEFGNSLQDLYQISDRNKPLKDLYKPSGIQKPDENEEDESILDLTPLGTPIVQRTKTQKKPDPLMDDPDLMKPLRRKTPLKDLYKPIEIKNKDDPLKDLYELDKNEDVFDPSFFAPMR